MFAVAHDPITDREALHAETQLGYTTNIAIPQRQRLVQLAPHRLHRSHQPIRAHLVQHQAHLVRLLAGLVHPVRLAELHEHPLGAGGNQGSGGVIEKLAWPRAGSGHLGQLGGALSKVLEDLLHTRIYIEPLIRAYMGADLIRSFTALISRTNTVFPLSDRPAKSCRLNGS